MRGSTAAESCIVCPSLAAEPSGRKRPAAELAPTPLPPPPSPKSTPSSSPCRLADADAMDEAICTDDDCPDHSAAADHCTTAIKVTSAMSRMHVVIARHHMHFGCGAAARRPSFSSTARMGRQRSGKRRRATSAGFGPLRLMVPPSHLQRGPATHACGRLIRDVMHAWTYAACKPPFMYCIVACFSLGNSPFHGYGLRSLSGLCSLLIRDSVSTRTLNTVGHRRPLTPGLLNLVMLYP